MSCKQRDTKTNIFGEKNSSSLSHFLLIPPKHRRSLLVANLFDWFSTDYFINTIRFQRQKHSFLFTVPLPEFVRCHIRPSISKQKSMFRNNVYDSRLLISSPASVARVDFDHALFTYSYNIHYPRLEPRVKTTHSAIRDAC